MKTKTKNMVVTAILVAVMLLFGFTPVGYIPLPFAKITLMCVPLIIGVLVLGWKTGLVLSGVFILTSLFQLFTAPDAVSIVLFDYSPAYVLALVIPRIAIPFVVYWVNMIFREKRPYTGYVVSAVAGSMTNTVLYLLILQLFFTAPLSQTYGVDEAAASGIIWFVVLTNGLPEAAAAALICPPVVRAIKKRGN